MTLCLTGGEAVCQKHVVLADTLISLMQKVLGGLIEATNTTTAPARRGEVG